TTKAVESSITEKELKAANKPEIRASHILVSDEKTAKDIKSRLAKGEDFATLAKKYSTDPGSKDKGGDLGYFGVGKMIAEFEDAAYKLNVGQISDIVQTTNGYHIIKLTDKKTVKDFNKLTAKEKEDLKTAIVNKKYNDGSAQDIINKIMKKAHIEVKDKQFKGLFD